MQSTLSPAAGETHSKASSGLPNEAGLYTRFLLQHLSFQFPGEIKMESGRLSGIGEGCGEADFVLL